MGISANNYYYLRLLMPGDIKQNPVVPSLKPRKLVYLPDIHLILRVTKTKEVMKRACCIYHAEALVHVELDT